MREQDMIDAKDKAMKEAKRMIWVTFKKEGIHKYPAALDDPSLATGDEYDVSFLGYPHRHIFHFKVGIAVTHNDRDIEFIQFKRWMEKLYAEKTLELDYKSCEMMSDDLYDQEFECSFQAAITGSYYGALIEKLESDKRITDNLYDENLDTETWWDLGLNDSTAIWFVQRYKGEIRLIDYYEKYYPYINIQIHTIDEDDKLLPRLVVSKVKEKDKESIIKVSMNIMTEYINRKFSLFV